MHIPQKTDQKRMQIDCVEKAARRSAARIICETNKCMVYFIEKNK